MQGTYGLYWNNRYATGNTGWDVGAPTPPITTYLDQIEDKNVRILFPGGGNAHEAAYAWKKGFKEVYVLDIAEIPLQQFALNHPSFPKERLLRGDFFDHQGTYDLIFEQTFFCSFPPTQSNRSVYAEQMDRLLYDKGHLVGVWFDFPLESNQEHPPFGGSKAEYRTYFAPYFDTLVFERCKNSISARQGTELFGIFQKK